VKEKKMLPVLGQDDLARPPIAGEEPSGSPAGFERTVVSVEGMDCANCAATVEKQVLRLPGVHRATVNFAAGRLDAEHDPELALEKIERAVRDAGYGVAKAGGDERPSF